MTANDQAGVLYEALKNECNRYVNPHCQLRACMISGGWKPGDPTPVDFNVATCPAHAALETITAQAKTIAGLREWLPIESAPKDGTEILASTKNGVEYIACWFDVCGWFNPAIYETDDTAQELYRDPVAWMPLPTPPAAGGST